MAKMMLKRTTWNDGYWCGCCHHEWENCAWVDDVTPEEFVQLVYQHLRDSQSERESCCDFQGVVYEQEGDEVFRCNVDGGKSWECWTLVRGDGSELEVHNWQREKNPKQGKLDLEKPPTEEEALQWILGQNP